ncbi:MAG: hypothetical protein FD160_4162, partial [Caulobacteraceae bacterium]
MNLRLVLTAVAVAVTLFLGAWGQAEVSLTDRVRQVALGANGVCNAGRGMGAAPPVAQDIVKRFTALAADNSLEAFDVHVRMEPLRPGQGGMMGGVMAQLGGMTGGALKMDATQVTVDGIVRGKQWLWSKEQPVTGTCLLQGKVERVLPS